MHRPSRIIVNALLRNALLLVVLFVGAAFDQARTPAPVLPPVVLDRVGVAKIFDYKVNYELQRSPAKPDFIWGPRKPVDGVFSTRYIAFDRDVNRAHDEAWYKANRPDWLVYQCNRDNLAVAFKYDFGYYAPIDIGNDTVRNDFLHNLIEPALSGGYQGIAFDNVAAVNYAHRCGTKTNGDWRALFTGKTADPGYADAVRDWLIWMRERIHAKGGAVAINHFFSAADIGGFDRVAAEADIVVDEGGFSRACKPKDLEAAWRARFQSFRRIAAERALVVIDQICNPLTNVTPQLASWSLANYLLIRGQRTYLSMTDYKTTEPPSQPPQTGDASAELPIGAPAGDPDQNDGLYTRRYQNGAVVVNPSATRTIDFDTGGSVYRDLLGTTWKGHVSVGPASGHVLLRQ